jgi:hypothetical protein
MGFGSMAFWTCGAKKTLNIIEAFIYLLKIKLN